MSIGSCEIQHQESATDCTWLILVTVFCMFWATRVNEFSNKLTSRLSGVCLASLQRVQFPVPES